MEVSTEKSKVMVNTTIDITANINMNGERLEEVNSFKYLGATLTKDGCRLAEMSISTATATSAMARLDKVWKSSNISFRTKYRLFNHLSFQSSFMNASLG